MSATREVRIDPICLHLKRARERCGMSLRDVEARSGGAVGRGSVYEWETGRHQPRIDSLRKWAAVFGLKVTTLQGKAVGDDHD